MDLCSFNREIKSAVAKYKPVAPYQKQEDLDNWGVTFIALFGCLVSGGDLKKMVLEIEFAPDEQEANEFIESVNTPEQLLGEAKETLLLLVDAGVIEERANLGHKIKALR